ncbi:F0F1 ATP synthase subunit delta [Actinophytocola gossypii]|uniref:ATP synthase subunit delta n=1 Tax=Actinophytocola gossypii TaxID=2812003 RepID=A0ABT2JB43_9PSEU|nr:F0F1 ATP synthase subunit delta [Actinophytocola gossypii]MCT2585065.1 F0F1 ATP synthase subunit delta [Actinophytocola gossypii]
MTFHAASRDALAAAELTLLDVLGGADAKPASARARSAKAPAAPADDLGDELFSVVRLLDAEVGLRRALGDSSAEPERREQLLTGLLSGKVSAKALEVLAATVRQRWSTPRELVDGIDHLGRTALLVRAEREGRLDAVEDELFRFGRIVAGDTALEQALTDRAAPASAKAQLVRTLIGNQAEDVSVRLVEQLVVAPQGRPLVAGLAALADEAAKRRERSVAHVVSAGPLSAAQQERLSAALNRIYARPIALHVEVDPDIQGGLVVRVGDEVIDGSAIGRLDQLRRRLAG